MSTTIEAQASNATINGGVSTDTNPVTIPQSDSGTGGAGHPAGGPAQHTGFTATPMPTPTPLPVDNRNANAFAIASFVLGLVSIVAGWSFFAPVTGLVLGILALKRGTGERTLALWGVWLNGVLLALTALATLAFIGIVGFGALLAAV